MPLEVSLPFRPLGRGRIVCQRMGADTALYDPVTDTLHVLNATAALIWELCDGEHTLNDMEKAVCSSFHVSPDHVVRHDIEHIVTQFASKDLIEPGGTYDSRSS